MTKFEALQKSRIIWLAIAKESERRFAEGADPFVGKSWAYEVLGMEQQDEFLCPACQYTVDNSSNKRLDCTICPIWTEDLTRSYRCVENINSPYRQYALLSSTPKESVMAAKSMVELIDQRIAEIKKIKMSKRGKNPDTVLAILSGILILCLLTIFCIGVLTK